MGITRKRSYQVLPALSIVLNLDSFFFNSTFKLLSQIQIYRSTFCSKQHQIFVSSAGKRSAAAPHAGGGLLEIDVVQPPSADISGRPGNEIEVIEENRKG